MPASEYCSLHSAIGTSPTGGEFATQPAEPPAMDDLVRDLNDWVRTFAYDAPLRRCIERGADTIVALRVVVERQAREIADWKRKYGDAAAWKYRAERAERARDHYQRLNAALLDAIDDQEKLQGDHARAERELDRVKVQLTSEITAALAERDALKRELEITCAHLGLDKLLADRDALREKLHLRTCERDEAQACITTSADTIAALRECVRAADAMRRGEDCPMCDSGKLRNPAKEHWDSCAFANYDAARAKVKP